MICTSLWTLRLSYTLLGATRSFSNYNVHVLWPQHPSKPLTNCNLKGYLTMRLQELSWLLKRAHFSVLCSRSPRPLRHILWLAATKNRWLVSFHRQCELNPNNCLTTTCLCPLHTLPCPTSHAAQRILCSRVLTHVHVPSEFDAGISLYIDYTLAAFGSLICCQVVNRTTLRLNVSLFTQ